MKKVKKMKGQEELDNYSADKKEPAENKKSLVWPEEMEEYRDVNIRMKPQPFESPNGSKSKN